MKYIPLLFGLLLSFNLHAQKVNYTQEPGKVTQYEMSMTEYPQDKDAEAVVLYNLGHYKFTTDDREGFILQMKTRTKIKILKQAGEKYATFDIPYFIEDSRNMESVIAIKGITYNYEDNVLKKTDLSPKNIFEEKGDNDKWRVKKVALSDVHIGSVIEIEYTISTPFFFNMRTWDFQWKIPVIYSRIDYTAIPYYEYTYILKGTNKFDEFTNNIENQEKRFGNLVYNEKTYNFGMKNIPAFKDEEFITSEKDYRIALNFQMTTFYSPRGGEKKVMSTWPLIIKEFMKHDDFGKYINNSEKEGKKIIPTLNLDTADKLAQLQTITEYVKQTYNWDGYNGKLASQKASETIKLKKGNSADINLLLIGLLRSAQINVTPVVLSTRGFGIIKRDYPFQHFLNYVIAEVDIDGKKYYVDATEPMLYFSDLPEKCTNVIGLRVKSNVEEWVNMTQNILSMTERRFIISLNPETNVANINSQYASVGYNALYYRRIYMKESDNLIEYIKDVEKLQAHDLSIISDKNLKLPFIFQFQFEQPLEQVSNKIFLSPFCNTSPSENMFKQNSRTLPIDLSYIKAYNYKSNITIPEGYKIDHLPISVNINNALYTTSYSISQIEDGKQLEVKASFLFNSNIYDSNDYITLKMAYADMIKKFSEMIVLVKE